MTGLGGDWGEGAEGDILAQVGSSNRRLEKNCIMRSFMICANHRILLGRPNVGCDGRGMWHVWKGKYYRVLEGRSGGKGPNTRPNVRWDDKIIVQLNEKENVGRGLA